MRTLTSLCVVLLIAGTASAAVDFWVADVSDPVTMPGWVSNDLTVEMNGTDWCSSKLIVLPPVAGGIYQDSFGAPGGEEPNPSFFGMVPTLEFDTYVRDFILDGSGPSTAAAVPEYSTIIFDNDMLAIVWFTTEMDETGESALARVTLADSLDGGSWYFNVYGPDGFMFETTGWIEGGHMVPEPMTMSLLVIGGLALIRRRRA